MNKAGMVAAFVVVSCMAIVQASPTIVQQNNWKWEGSTVTVENTIQIGGDPFFIVENTGEGASNIAVRASGTVTPTPTIVFQEGTTNRGSIYYDNNVNFLGLANIEYSGNAIVRITASGHVEVLDAVTGKFVTRTLARGGMRIFDVQDVPEAFDNGVVIFSSKPTSGISEFWVSNSSDTATKLSAHNEDGDWVHHSRFKDGKVVYINMIAVVRELEKLSGKQLIYGYEPKRQSLSLK